MSLQKFELSYGELKEFYEYMCGFYGEGGIYSGEGKYFGKPMTFREYIDSLVDYLAIIEEKGYEFCGDSVDRESVRDMILEKRELEKAKA